MTTEKKQKLQDAIRQLRESYYDAIEVALKTSGQTYAEIGANFGCSEQTVYQISRLRCRPSQQSGNEQVNPSEISSKGDNHGEL